MRNFVKKVACLGKQYLQLLLEKSLKANEGIFVFHEIYSENETCVNEKYAMKAESFRLFIEGLGDAGCTVTSVDEIISERRKRCFAISFDDGYYNVYENAVSYLESNKLPYVMFIPFDFIGRDGYLGEEELHKLGNSTLCEIGGHSKSHAWLANFRRSELKQEISGSKVLLECMIGKAVRYMAYPYGSLAAVNWKSMRMAKKAGYCGAFSTLNVSNRWIRCKYFYPRITVTEDNWKQLLERFR